MSLYAKKMRVGQMCAKSFHSSRRKTQGVGSQWITLGMCPILPAWHFPSSDLALIDETRRSFVCGLEG